MTTQTSPRTPILRALALLSALLLLVAACGGTEETEAGSDDGSTGQPAEGELPVNQDEDSMDPNDEELPIEEPVDDQGQPGGYEPIAAMEDLVDPKPAAIDEVAVGTDQVIIVRYQNAYAPCSGARVTVNETDSSIEVLLETGLNPNAAAMTCLAGITGYEQTVTLSAPIGDRELVWEQAETASADLTADPLPSDDQQELLAPYLGLELAEAATKADGDGRTFRVAELDGEPMALTQDFVADRLNFIVEDGVVVDGFFG